MSVFVRRLPWKALSGASLAGIYLSVVKHDLSGWDCVIALVCLEGHHFGRVMADKIKPAREGAEVGDA